MKRVLIVEDDYLQAEWLRATLEGYFPSLNVQHMRTESEFRDKIEKLRRDPPDLVILDVMLRWADPNPRIAVPPEEAKNGFFRAGLRCERLLRLYKETRQVPVILYTVLQENDLGKELIKVKAPPTYLSAKLRTQTTSSRQSIRRSGTLLNRFHRPLSCHNRETDIVSLEQEASSFPGARCCFEAALFDFDHL